MKEATFFRFGMIFDVVIFSYTGKKKNSELAPEQREQKRLKYLLKQEKKGAEREIRLDAQYLVSQHLPLLPSSCLASILLHF